MNITNLCGEQILSDPQMCKLKLPKTEVDFVREGVVYAILDLLRNDMYEAAKFLAISWNLKQKFIDITNRDDRLMFNLFLKTL